METSVKFVIALCVFILFATLFIIVINRIQHEKLKTPAYTIDDLVDGRHDTTDEQRKIHRRAAEAEYWQRKDMDEDIYA